jgi:hypothetical protein
MAVGRGVTPLSMLSTPLSSEFLTNQSESFWLASHGPSRSLHKMRVPCVSSLSRYLEIQAAALVVWMPTLSAVSLDTPHPPTSLVIPSVTVS